MADPPGATSETATPVAIEPPRLLKQAELHYPDKALASGVHGDVTVLIDVASSGKVLDVRFESGPSAFRDVALTAAWELSFAPAMRERTPVAATTRVSFHFAPLEREDTPALEVMVHASDPDIEDIHARRTLTQGDIEQAAGNDLAETISKIPGVRVAGGMADAAKPMIRGQQERRLLVLFNGVRHESQKWGPDHATEIDPFSAGTISVVRGASGARYGPDAIGGVVLVEPPPLRSTPGVGGKAVAAFSSNGRRPYLAFRLDAAPENMPDWSFRVEGNGAVGASMTTPTYVLGNTASRTWNLGGAAKYTWSIGRLRASWNHHDFTAGVFYGVRNSTPTEFESQLNAVRPATADLWRVSYNIDRAYQQVSHDIGMLDLDIEDSWGHLEATYAFQVNHRLEFERARQSITGPQYDFTLRTHSLDIVYEHPTMGLSFGEIQGGIGLQASLQENVYRGLSLIPNFRSFAGGAFAFERLSLRRADLEAAVRVDALARGAYVRESDYEAHLRRDTMDPDRCDEPGESSVRCAALYEGASVSLGSIIHLVPDSFDLKAEVSSAVRFPSVDELFIVGSAPSFPVYAFGNPMLEPETTWGTSVTAGLRRPWLELEASTYLQRIDDFIYFAPNLNDDGRPRYDVTIRGTFPSYEFSSRQARFYGADGALSLGPDLPVGFEAGGAFVRGHERGAKTNLIGTPPDHLDLTAVGRLPPIGWLYRTELRLSTELIARQRRVRPSDDFAPAPDGAALLHASVQAEIMKDRLIRVAITGRNLLNARYRQYTSLRRYYADEPGRDVQLRIGTDF